MPRIVLFVLVAGVVIYGIVWLTQRLRDRRTTPPAPVAPDDDPVFLARLDRRLAEERRRAERERRQAELDEQGDAGTTGPASPTDEAPGTAEDAPDTSDDVDGDRPPA